MQQVDESKVKALESIFGGQDITASVIRTVLSSNDNKFDDAVDSLLNMTTSEEASARKEPPQEELNEDALLDKKEREKIKTLENMFGSDLSNSVICTVLESNKGELVDTVDTLLNMTSKDLNPQYQAEARKPVDRESERLRQEEDIKNYEEFKRLQIKLQEEETRAIKEQQRKVEEEAVRKSEEERRCVEEQDRILREYEAARKKQAEDETARKKKQEAEEAAREKKQQTEEAAREKKQQTEEAARKKKQEAEEAARKKKQEAEEVARKRKEAEETARKKKHDAEEASRKKRHEVEEAAKKKKLEDERKAMELKALEARQIEEAKVLLANLELEKAKKAHQEEERRLEQDRLQQAWEQRLNSLKEAEERILLAEAERKLVEDKRREELRLREELLNKKAQEEEMRLAKLREEEAKVLELKRIQFEEELNLADRRRKEEGLRHQQEQLRKAEAEVFQRKLAEEQAAEQMRLRIEQERELLQKERAALEAAVREQEELERQKKLEAERKRNEEIAREEQRRREVELQEQQRRAEEQRIREEQAREEARKRQEEEDIKRQEAEEKAREEEEARRTEQELIERKQEEEARARLQRAEEEAQRQEEELKAKEARQLAYDQMAASAVFIPPKAQVPEGNTITATVSGDTVICNWDLPEGNAAPTNWLGLYPVRALAGTKKYTHFAYTNNTSTGQTVFRGVTPGQYEVRFFATRAYEDSARSAPVCVGSVATVMPQVQGDHVLVCYTLSPFSQAPKSDWLGIYEKDQRRNKLYLSTAYGNAEGQVMMKAPRTPGTYEVRLFASGAVYNEQAKADFVIEDNDCVNVEPTSVMAGTNVNINWVLRTLEPSTGDWVGLYRADEASNNNYLSCTYTNGAGVGIATVQAPKEVGVYELRLFAKAKGKYTTHRTSSPLIVV